MIDVPVLETERLVLRGPKPEDAEVCMTFLMSERAHWVGQRATREKAWRSFAIEFGHWAVRGFGSWAVTWRGDDRCIGLVGGWYPEGWPEKEIGWMLWDGAEGKGVAYEAAVAARRHLYCEMGWTTAVSYIDEGNHRSIALAERLGATIDPTAEPLGGDPGFVYRHPSPAALGLGAAA